MGLLEGIGAWIAANESLLSGLAALVAVAGVIISPIFIAARRMRSGPSEAMPAAAIRGATRKLSFDDLVSPSPHPIHFAESGGLRIAYTQFGKGTLPILLAPGVVSHLHICSNLPSFRDCLEVFAEFGQVTAFDKRGQGLSDPWTGDHSLKERCSDINAVMDAAGLDSVVLAGVSEGGPMCVQYAYDHPDRVRGLILIGSTARWLQDEDFPAGIPGEYIDNLWRLWGTGKLRAVFFPSLSKEVVDNATYRSMERAMATPDSMVQLSEFMKRTDVRPLLPKLRVPTLVIHFTGDLAIPIRLARVMAESIPGARFVEVSGSDHADISQSPEAVAAIRDFCAKLA